jgi:Flp pilus assembly protein TadB
VSKERARRRAEREAAAAAEREARQRSQARTRKVEAVKQAATAPLRQSAGRQTALQRQRAKQNGILAASVLAAHVALWLLVPSWVIRIGALVLTALAWPLLLVVLFDRRPSS